MPKATSGNQPTFEDLFGTGPVRAAGESALDPSFLARKTEYADAKKRFIGVVPIGSDTDNHLRAESARSLLTTNLYQLGQIVFYCYTEGSDKRVLGVAVPDSPIKFRYPFYQTFRDSVGNFVSEFQRNMVDQGFAIFDPPGLHGFANDETKEKNKALLEKVEAERQKAIEDGLAGL